MAKGRKQTDAPRPAAQPPVAQIFASRLKHRQRMFDGWPDYLTSHFGTIWFLNLNVVFFAAWILVNLGLIPGMPVFDPYPFGMLTMCVSLEAIVLSIAVLISQNRDAKIADLREEIDFQVNVQAEREITHMIRMLSAVQRKLGIREKKDAELEWMKTELDLQALEKRIRNEIN